MFFDDELDQSARFLVKGRANLAELWQSRPARLPLYAGRYAEGAEIASVVPQWGEPMRQDSAAVWVEAFTIARDHFVDRKFQLILDLTNLEKCFLLAEGLDEYEHRPSTPSGFARI